MKNLRIQILSDSRWRMKSRSFLQWVTIIIAFWSFLIKPIGILPSPLSYLKYVPDAVLLAMLLLCMGKEKIKVRKDILTVLRIAIAFFLYCAVAYIFQYQSVAYFLWGFRNNFRFYIAFFAFIAMLNEADVITWFKVVHILFWINAVLSILQFFILGISGDDLGGIFGILGSSNGFTLCFMSIVVCESLLEAFNGRETFSKSMFTCVVSIMVAAMAEMKFYFFVFVFLLLGAAVITRISIKKVLYLLLASVAVMVGTMLLVEWFGFRGFFSLQSLWEAATKENYSSYGDINRLSAIPTLSKQIMDNALQRIFGLGLGNCDTSAFAICNTPFYRTYEYLHYTWFTSSMMFLETGYLGLGIYISFFVACFLHARRNFRNQIGNQLYNQLSILISILCVVLTVYNSSLRIESGYMMYFVLALPFIRQSPGKKVNEPPMLPKKEVIGYE